MEGYANVPQALDALRAGGFVIIVDDENRENEGDLVLAAEHMTEEKMVFMIRHTGGVVCLPISTAVATALHLPPMVEKNTSKFETPFTVSIDAHEGNTTGISAGDRVRTVLKAADPSATSSDFQRPGHIFPLCAQEGGVLVRAGHTEATVDLCRLAKLREVGVLSELMREDGSMMRGPDLLAFGKEHGIPVLTIAELIAERRRTERLVRLAAESDLETDIGTWKIKVFDDLVHGREHVAMVMGDVSGDDPVLVRVHSECLTGDVFHSRHCDCGEQLNMALHRIADEGRGVLVYMRQEGRGIGLANKIRAYDVQQKEGLDTVEANERLGFPSDLREYGIGAQMLCELGVHRIRLLTNNPKKIAGLAGYGLEVVEHVRVFAPEMSERQKKYLRAKKEKMGHLFDEI